MYKKRASRPKKKAAKARKKRTTRAKAVDEPIQPIDPLPRALQHIERAAALVAEAEPEPIDPKLLETSPDWLHTKPVALRKWHEIYVKLMAARQLEIVDWDLLAVYCDCWQEIEDADSILRREGEWQYSEKGWVSAHPAVTKRNTAIDRLKKIAIDLGIGFRARKGTRGTGGSSDTSDLDEF
jgi:P27 family predicted phage terminase small subunit